jgi:hypothetical protein
MVLPVEAVVVDVVAAVAEAAHVQAAVAAEASPAGRDQRKVRR